MKTESNRLTSDQNVRKLAELIDGFECAVLTTVDVDGSLHSRPMATLQQIFSGELWFFASNRSDKIRSIRGDQHVNVAYVDTNRQRYVSVAGRATVIEDKAKMAEFWTPGLVVWFPEGLNDPDLCLISVHVESAEYWDSPANTLGRLVGFASGSLGSMVPEGTKQVKNGGSETPTFH